MKDFNVQTAPNKTKQGLSGEYTETGELIRGYGYKPDSIWTTDPLYLKTNGQYYFYHNGHLGTPQKLTRTNGEVVWDARYTDFVKAYIKANKIENPLRFAGQYHDTESNLYYNYHRYYDPELGRYITSDPIGLEGGINTYAYVGGRPLRSIDPLGLTEGDDGETYESLPRTLWLVGRNHKNPSYFNDKVNVWKNEGDVVIQIRSLMDIQDALKKGGDFDNIIFVLHATDEILYLSDLNIYMIEVPYLDFSLLNEDCHIELRGCNSGNGISQEFANYSRCSVKGYTTGISYGYYYPAGNNKALWDIIISPSTMRKAGVNLGSPDSQLFWPVDGTFIFPTTELWYDYNQTARIRFDMEEVYEPIYWVIP